MHLSLIENLHFHFIRNCDRVSNWLKSCDRSIFSLHVQIVCDFVQIVVFSELNRYFKMEVE